MKKISKKFLAGFVALVLSIQSGWAQGAVMPPANALLLTSGSLSLPVIRGLQFDADEPLSFNFVIDLADRDNISEEEALKLVRYFMAVLAVPERDVWVNLSPDGEERMIAPGFGETEAGEDLLKQDLVLKQLSASFLHPDTDLGRTFWEAAHEKIYQAYGITEIPQDAFQRIWIVPDRAVLDEFKNAVYISESRLKVLLADEYESLKHLDGNPSRTDADGSHTYVTQVLREVVLPEIERQVNEGGHFAVLRQIYHSMILAVWFKNKLGSHPVNRLYGDSSKTQGIDFADAKSEAQIFQSYLDIFRNGLYDAVREEYDPVRQDMTVRRYVSGGFGLPAFDDYAEVRKGGNLAMLNSRGKSILVGVALFLSGIGSVMAGNFEYGVNSVLSHQWPGQKVTAVQTSDVGQYTGDYTLLGQFAKFSHVEKLMANSKYGANVKWILTKNGVNGDNYNEFLADEKYNEVDEVFVLAIQGLLGLEMDGDFGPKLEAAIKDNLKIKNAQNSNNDSDGSDGNGGDGDDGDNGYGDDGYENTPSQQQNPAGDVANPGPQASPGGGFVTQMVSFEGVDSLVSVDTIGQGLDSTQNVPVAPLAVLTPSATRDSLYHLFQSGKMSQVDFDRYILSLVEGASVDGAEPPPPPDPVWNGFFYNDFFTPMGQYGLAGVSLQNGLKGLNLSGTAELAGSVDEEGNLNGSIGLYTGISYSVTPSLGLTVTRRDEVSGGVEPLTIVGGSYNFDNGVSVSGQTAFSNPWSDVTNDHRPSQTSTVSFNGKAGRVGIFSTLAFYSDLTLSRMSDVAFTLSVPAGAATFYYANNMQDGTLYNTLGGLAPDQFRRLGFTYPLGAWEVGLYGSSTTMDPRDLTGLGFGGTVKYSFTTAKPGTAAASAVVAWPAVDAFAYTDFWHNRSSRTGQYGKYGFNVKGGEKGGKENAVGVTALAETGLAYDAESGTYSTSAGGYWTVNYSLPQQGPVSGTLGVGMRRALKGAVTPVNFVKAGLSTEKASIDVTYARSTFNDAGRTVHLRGGVAYLSLTPTPWLTLAPTIVYGKKGAVDTYTDFGLNTSLSFGGFGFNYAINPKKGAEFDLAPDQPYRGAVSFPTINITGNLNIDASVYAASNTAKWDDPMFGFTTNITLGGATGATDVLSLGDLSVSMMALADLPSGTDTSAVAPGGSFSSFDVGLLRFMGAHLTRDDFKSFYGGRRGVKFYKRFQRAMKDLDSNYEGDYFYYNDESWLGYGISVAHNVLSSDFGGLRPSRIFTSELRGALYTVQMKSSQSGEELSNNQAMMNPDGKADVGGIDLSGSADSVETRVRGVFEGLDNVQLAIDPALFQGFGVRLIHMTPIFDLGKVFVPTDDDPVMISQL